MTHARHRTMLDVVLGESLEHQRLFEQAAAGFEDVLGRRTGGAERVGAVLPTRWRNSRVTPSCGRPRQQSRRSREPAPPALAALRALHPTPARLVLPRHRAGRRRAAAHVAEAARSRGDLARRAALLERLLAIEQELGRERPYPARRGRSIWI